MRGAIDIAALPDDPGHAIWKRDFSGASGLFGVIQRSNCLAVLPEGGEGRTAGSMVECILLDVNEDVCL